MNAQTDTPVQDAVYATLASGRVVRVSDPSTWDRAQAEWRKLDEARLDGRFPDVRYFEVRRTDDPRYADAPVSLGHSTPYMKSRGYSKVEGAARRAWLLWQGETSRDGLRQGSGGWFRWHNGRSAAQGLDELAKLAKSRGLVVQGVDGRWYPAVSEL